MQLMMLKYKSVFVQLIDHSVMEKNASTVNHPNSTMMQKTMPAKHVLKD